MVRINTNLVRYTYKLFIGAGTFMKIKKIMDSIFIITILLTTNLFAADKIKIVTSLPDLADIARQIGGDKVEVVAIAKGYQDPHFVDPKPSHILKMTRADLFIHIGLDLEIGWVPPLLEKARNRKIYYSGTGYLNASKNIDLLEVPNIDPAELRAQGDIHIYGNPHYWLDPENGKIIAKNICDKLIAIQPEDSGFFQGKLDSFIDRLDAAIRTWEERMMPYKNVKIIAYHNSWPYFAKRFHIDVVNFIEPKPGIPPTPRHLVSVIKRIRTENIKVIIISPYFDDKPAQTVASKTGATVVSFAPSVEAFKGVDNYLDLFEYNLNELIKAFENYGNQESK